MIDVRQTLRDAGFAVGERGRFSAEMIAFLNDNHPGVLDANGKVAKAPKAKVEPKVVVTQETNVSEDTRPVADPIPTLPQVREDKVMWAVTPVPATGSHAAIAYDVCQSCKNSIRVCPCATGPKPPAGAIPVRSYAEAKSRYSLV